MWGCGEHHLTREGKGVGASRRRGGGYGGGGDDGSGGAIIATGFLGGVVDGVRLALGAGLGEKAGAGRCHGRGYGGSGGSGSRRRSGCRDQGGLGC